ncbi:hypothetical protein CCP2SC5_1500003 [Azospirillaceae bacterium]
MAGRSLKMSPGARAAAAASAGNNGDPIVELRCLNQPKVDKSGLPTSAAERAEVLIDLSKRLVHMYERESVALERNRLADLAKLIPEKHKTSVVYEEIARQLRVDQAGMAELDDDLRGRLREAVAELREIANNRFDDLRRRGQAQHYLVNVIAEAINQSIRGASRYTTHRGQLVSVPATQSLVAVPAVSFNQKL